MPTPTQLNVLYEQDFLGWVEQQVEFLQQRQLDQLDLENLIVEIESLGRKERQELENRLGILLGHLLKWHYQPERRSKSWRATIHEQRRKIQRHLQENPRLRTYLDQAITIGYEDALALIDRETPLDSRNLPQACPFSESQIFTEVIEL